MTSSATKAVAESVRLRSVTVSEMKGLAAVIEAAIREIVREEVRVALMDRQQLVTAPSPTSLWVTPPVAARQTGVSARTIRALVKAGTITSRSRNSSPEPRQRKLLVNLDDVASVISRGAGQPRVAMAPDEVVRAAARIRARAVSEEE